MKSDRPSSGVLEPASPSAPSSPPAPAAPVRGIPVEGIEVGTDLLTRRIAPCSLSACGGQCCRFGAMVEAPEIDQIDALLPRILPSLRPAARRVIRRHGWAFNQWIHERYADPEKRCRASRVAEGLCVFVLDEKRGGCALHQAALEDGVPVERYKPRECVLFPLADVVRGQLHLHGWPGYPCTAHAPREQPAWQALEGELKLILGSVGYQVLSDAAEGIERQNVPLEPVVTADPPPVPRGRPPRRHR